MMKKLAGQKLTLAVVLVTVIAWLCITTMAASALSFPFTTVTLDETAMRSKASANGQLVGTIPGGATVEVLGDAGSYYKISYRGSHGYVLMDQLDMSEKSVVTPSPSPVPTASGYPYDTTANAKVNLRSARSKTAKILKTIPEGGKVIVEAVKGSYATVLYNGVEGYVRVEYLNLKEIVTPTPVPTAAPTEAAEAAPVGYNLLENGSTGDEVIALQNALDQLGYYHGAIDGKYGNGTASAVSALQAANGYPETGTADANLQALIYSGKPKAANGKTMQVTVLAPVEGTTIKLNNIGKAVTRVQEALTELGFYSGSLGECYDKATANAVKSFQKKNGLKADGVCTAETQRLLFSGNALPVGATPTPKPTATPTPEPTFNVPSSDVYKGSTGTDVLLVQERLKELGYYTGKLDGKFGDGCVKSLKAFQQANGLKADGKAGSATYAVLFSSQAISYAEANATPTPTPKVDPTATPSADDEALNYVLTLDKKTCVTVKKGIKGIAVLAVQKRLTELGYLSGKNDGQCGDAEVTAIRVFQEMNGLKADGAAGYSTQSVMFSDAALKSDGSRIDGATVYPMLRRGMSGDAVERLQNRLIELGYLTGEADGNYGAKTADAVYRFQKTNGLPKDSIAGNDTQALLYSEDAKPAEVAATPAPTATPAATNAVVTLRKGDHSDAVKKMQEKLIKLGYLTGSADGTFGVQTYRALIAFQKANNLSADGKAGAKTQAALNSNQAVANTQAQATAAPNAGTSGSNAGTSVKPTASAVRYANWYTEIKNRCKTYPYATVYDYTTGLSWQVHMFSLGAHADAEPLTANDTAKMERAFGGNTWTPKAVWVVFGDGRIYMASTHSMPHAPQHRTDNNFNGHMCIHFPRTAAQVAAIGSYATSHQQAIDAGWAKTQLMK